jgi:hypothetical protein
MDSTKTAIKSLVLDLRKSLEADIEVGLRRYGITPTALRPVESLSHLDDRGKTARIRMEEALRHEMGRDENEGSLAEAVHWFVREVAFTHLNRMVGLKAMEVRGLIPEIIQTRAEFGNRSRALRDFRDEHPEAATMSDDGLEGAIRAACRQIYPEFRLLFDVGDPAEMREAPVNSLVWPSTPTLKGCITKINELDIKIGRLGAPAYGKATAEQSVWAEDEIIGWVYQFYNAEEKVSIRDKGKPQHPAEVAVINQFFTPRWIVKFLVDNTLGRLWLEMHPDSTRVREKCDYLVPEPVESGKLEGGDVESPINNPDAAPRRKEKRPQDIRLIDPACGTMHFGHYAFEVFQEMYAEAREKRWISGVDALADSEVPAAILQNNLFGVDIDLRAAQLAALSLFMKAKSANPDGRVGQVNLVVADAHLPHGKVREEFLAQYASEPVIQKAFHQVFESLDNVAEVGSLLRVEERFRQSLEAGGFQSKTPKKKRNEADGQQAAFAEIAPGWSLEHTVEQMLGHLRQFARHALQEHDLNAQLFAAETEKSVALLDVFLHEYDVVVMNPPYGNTLASAQEYLNIAYPDGKNDLYAAFLDQAISLTKHHGFVGALTSNSFLKLLSFENLRKKILSTASSFIMLDLGFNILDDAMVETSATVFGTTKKSGDNRGIFIRLKDFKFSERLPKFENALNAIKNEQENTFTFTETLAEFSMLHGSPIAYAAPQSMKLLFSKLPTVQPKIGEVKQGLATADDARFVRQWWEVGSESIGMGKKWAGFAKGGDFSRYYYNTELVVLWENQGQEIRNFKRAFIRNEKLYFRQGLTYPLSTIKGFNIRYLPENHIWGHVGPSIIMNNDNEIWSYLGLLNSSLIEFLLRVLVNRNFEVGLMQKIPVAPVDNDFGKEISLAARKIYEIKLNWDTGNEISTHFHQPWIIQVINGSLTEDLKLDKPNTSNLEKLVDYLLYLEATVNEQLQTLQSRIDANAYLLYSISESDKEVINVDVSNRPLEIVWAYAEKMSSKQKASDHVARLISYCLLTALHDDPDGIFPLTEVSGHDTALRQVQAELENHFGESAAYQVELDSAPYLGRPLGEWLFKNFWKDFHVKWYKSRPILWQLQSQKGHFACLVHIHKMDRDTLPKVRSQYLWPSRNACQAALESARLREDAGERSAAKEVERLEAILDDLKDFEKRLSDVIEAHVQCPFPNWAQGPYRNGIYDPVLDDGVAVNILPLQTAGLLAKNKVV